MRASLAACAVLALSLSSLSACATGAKTPSARDADTRALYQAHTGAPVDKFRLFGRLTRWESLGDSALVVWTRPSEAWLLDLTGPCPDLEHAYAIGLTDSAGSVHARFDKVLVSSRSPVKLPCFIAQIRPVDTKALKVARDQARAARQSSGT